MNDLSNIMRFQHAQECYDRRAPHLPSLAAPTYRELEKDNEHLREQLVLLLSESRDGGNALNRWAPCAGNRLLPICNEIEGIDHNE